MAKRGRVVNAADESCWKGRVAFQLRKLRVAAGYESQRSFRDALFSQGVDVSQVAVSAWERGEYLYSVEYIPAICAVLKVSPSGLFPGNPEKKT